MSLLIRHRHVLAVSLVVVGLVFVLSFNAVGIVAQDREATVSATAFDPATEPETLEPDHTVYVVDTGSPLGDEPREAVETAATDGEFDGEVSNAQAQFFATDSYEYVVFDGAVYAFESTVDGESVTLEFDERDPASAASEIAAPVDEAESAARDAIETGEPASTAPSTLENPIVETNGEFYAVTPDIDPGMALTTVIAPITTILAAVGVAFAITGGWLFRRFQAGEVRPLTVRRGTVLAAAAAPGMLVVSVLFRSGSSPMWVVVGTALAVASGLLLVAGVALARERLWRLAATLLGGPALLLAAGLVAAVLAGPVEGVMGVIFGAFGLVVVGIFAAPLVLVGYRFAVSGKPALADGQ
ncbi:hypothetical protein [Natrarchaeobaculum sulfurireducens]|uniref:Uncharacterized protein n=1 Tax=Natrarchaeobaculum sulfurireducens TaxID=2044521 RepID=A0A346PSP6_9EURY|nr:hypothetical protein [Natrarchaeobaculum sulfurireducens]AXR82541.1 hypothetical protein AArcMg_2550 [Natrarchaeobaculum sulfurireducens]